LVSEFHDRIRKTPHTWMESAGEQFFENTPFHAVSEMLSRWLELQGTISLEEQFERLEGALASAGLHVDETASLITELLQLPVGERYLQLKLTPEEKRRRLLSALAGWAFGAARVQPMVMVVEDLHWLDPSTLDWQQMLAEQGATVPLMLLHTARPEFRAPWPLRAHHTQITLNRLKARDVREMVAQVAAHKALTDETVKAVVERTSGVPLFVEELTREVVERGATRLGPREIPVTLHDSLMARLDRLGPAKEVIQVGAVIGGEFSYGLLRLVHPVGEARLQQSLHQLTDAELLYVRGIPPDASYEFKHALIRDAAYEALLKSRRRELHCKIAETITDKFGELAETRPELLARHWAEAGEIELAVTNWLRAAKAGEARGAFREALEDYRQALVLVHLLPESGTRDLRELELRIGIVHMLSVTRGYSAAETVDATERFVALAHKSGNVPQLVVAALRRGFTAYVSGDLLAAGSLADEALVLALHQGSHADIARAHGLQIWTRYWRGDFAGVEKHFAAGLEFFDDPGYREDRGGGAYSSFALGSWNAWMVGRPVLALQRESLMTAAVHSDDPYDLAYTAAYAARLRLYMQEFEQAETLVARALELSEKHKFPYLLALCRCLMGRARAKLGDSSEAIELIRHGMAGLRAIGSGFGITSHTAYLAEAQAHKGAIAEALETLEQALQANPDEHAHRPEILRLRGELRLQQRQAQMAENDFREAIAVARSMGAKAWELRTTMSLARLLASQGSHDKARAMLTDIYNRFTEGFDTADLKDAKALFDEL
jgi:tetratricopeptide (TPR) repeat protein